MKRSKLCVVAVLLAVGSTLAFAGDRRDTPMPFESTNRRAELADGELYTLVGRVVFVGDQAMLEVDLNEHPWLASTKRRNDPFYPIVQRSDTYRQFEGRRVLLQARARAVITITPAPAAYSIWLSILGSPVLSK